MIRIVIADDHKLFRETLRDILMIDTNLQVVALCGDSKAAIDIVRAEKPDIVLMDINITPFSGIEATRQIVAFSAARVIGLSMHASAGSAKKMIRAGALGYITKNSSKGEILEGLSTVARGNRYICHEIRDILADSVMSTTPGQPNADLLSAREIGVIKLIRDGLSSKEIALKLMISVKTVDVHRHNVLKKLNLRNASSLINFVCASGEYFS